jgi:hypothetical protein
MQDGVRRRETGVLGIFVVMYERMLRVYVIGLEAQYLYMLVCIYI